MSESKSDSLNWILGAALLLIAAFVLGAIVMSNSQASDDVATDVNVDNTAPTIQVSLGNSTTPGVQSNNFDSSGITINTGRDAETQVRVGITVSDLNGVADFRNIKWQFSKSGSTCDSEADMNAMTDGYNSGKHTCFYDENVSGILSSTGAPDGSNLSAGTTAGTPTTTAQYYVTTLNLPSYIGSTDASGQYPVDTWTLTATVTDGNGSTDSATVSAEVNTSSEVAFEKTFTFPESIALNAETTVSQNVEHGFEAISNANNSIEVSSSSDFTCDVSGGFARANLRHGLVDSAYSTADASKAITSVSVDTDLNLGYRNSAAIVNKNLYWNIRIDDDSVNGEGAAGNCSNTLTALTTSN